MDDPFVSSALTLLALLSVAVVMRPLSLKTRVPYSILLVLCGVGLGLVPSGWSTPWRGLTDAAVFSELIMAVLLPTLVFETALNLNAKQLLANAKAVLFLAVPGLLISAFIITGIVALLVGIPWEIALLLGVLLSATDPFAVVEEFKRIRAPGDLTVIVEGESLFNDASTIVLTKIIMLALAAELAMQEMAWSGSLGFVIALFGGGAYGWLLGRIAYALLVRLRNDPYIEITLTLLLAYGSYLSAEYMFHTSGIISTVVAALVLARERPLPVPSRIERQLNSFWHFLSFVATSLIFLMVGLIANIELTLHSVYLAIVLISAMLISRAAVIYG